MTHVPVLRWGEPYRSMDVEIVRHFATGEPLLEISRANAGIVQRDLRRMGRAREALQGLPIRELIGMAGRAGSLFRDAELPLGDGRQTPEQFIKLQSAATGLPEHMCRANIEKNVFVLENLERILDCLTRGLDVDILVRGYGDEGRGVPVSYQVQSPVLGAVLPSNSPGVHALWLPVIALQVGLVLKPGSQEPWTPYRIAEAFFAAGVPRTAIAIYPGHAEVANAVLAGCPRSLVFGGESTVQAHRGDPRVQVHGPGFSKVLLAADSISDWETYLDTIVDSVMRNGGRSCINASGVWVPPGHGGKMAVALAERLGPIEPLAPEDPQAQLAAFTAPAHAEAIWAEIERGLGEMGVTHATQAYGPRLIRHDRHAYVRPVVVHCESPQAALANKEYLFPFVSVVECPVERLIEAIGPTLVCTAITEDARLQRGLLDATHIDRLNIGPIATTQINWLQPHEGNLTEFLFRPRAFQGKAVV